MGIKDSYKSAVNGSVSAEFYIFYVSVEARPSVVLRDSDGSRYVCQLLVKSGSNVRKFSHAYDSIKEMSSDLVDIGSVVKFNNGIEDSESPVYSHGFGKDIRNPLSDNDLSSLVGTAQNLRFNKRV